MLLRRGENHVPEFLTYCSGSFRYFSLLYRSLESCCSSRQRGIALRCCKQSRSPFSWSRLTGVYTYQQRRVRTSRLQVTGRQCWPTPTTIVFSTRATIAARAGSRNLHGRSTARCVKPVCRSRTTTASGSTTVLVAITTSGLIYCC